MIVASGNLSNLGFYCIKKIFLWAIKGYFVNFVRKNHWQQRFSPLSILLIVSQGEPAPTIVLSPS
jgi:hypothetical protein